MSAPLDTAGSVALSLRDSTKPNSKAGLFTVNLFDMVYGDPDKLERVRDKVASALAKVDDNTDPLDAASDVLKARSKFTESAFESLTDLFVKMEVVRHVGARRTRSRS